MAQDIIQDTRHMLDHYGFGPDQMTPGRLAFRLDLLAEEMGELEDAHTTANAGEFVDALIDITVIALGTLQLCDIDIDRAWQAVHAANMTKSRGAKPGRHSDGWDLTKPVDWQAPCHDDNVGILPSLFDQHKLEKTL